MLVTKQGEYMKTYNECMTEYWGRIVPMCKGTALEGKEVTCVKIFGATLAREPVFHNNFEHYTFAVAIVEGLPVFYGDVIYTENGLALLVTTMTESFVNDKCTWDVPKPKIYKTVDLTKDEYNAVMLALGYVGCHGSVARELYIRLQ